MTMLVLIAIVAVFLLQALACMAVQPMPLLLLLASIVEISTTIAAG